MKTKFFLVFWSFFCALAIPYGTAVAAGVPEKILAIQHAQVVALQNTLASYNVLQLRRYQTNCDKTVQFLEPIALARIGKVVFLGMSPEGWIACPRPASGQVASIWFDGVPSELLPRSPTRCFYGNDSPGGFGLLIVKNPDSGHDLEFYADADGGAWSGSPIGGTISLKNSSCSWIVE